MHNDKEIAMNKDKEESSAVTQISVIVPVFNNQHTIAEAINSVLEAENSEQIEILVVDDGSTDRSWQILQDIYDKYREKISLYRHRINRGAGSARNTGIRASRGEYVAFLDADDLFVPHRFEESIAMLQSQPSLDGAIGNVRTVFLDESEKAGWGKRPAVWPRLPPTAPDKILRVALLEQKSLWHMDTILVRKRLFEKTGMFSETLRIGEDRELWLRMLLVGNIAPISSQEAIAAVRRNGRSTWRRDLIQDKIRDVLGNVAGLRWARRHKDRVSPERLRDMEEIVAVTAPDLIAELRDLGQRRLAVCTALRLAARKPGLVGRRRFVANAVYGLTGR